MTNIVLTLAVCLGIYGLVTSVQDKGQSKAEHIVTHCKAGNSITISAYNNSLFEIISASCTYIQE